MDTTEDLSARVLVKHILNVEPPRTPLTRSASAAARISSCPRRSSRLDKNNPAAQTPQLMLRRSLKHKIRESISSKTFPSKRRTASIVKHTPGPTSVIFDDGDTPRKILKNILLTEPVKSPVVNEQIELQQPQPSPDLISQSRRHSIEVSGLDLPDLTIGNIETTVKRLNRKRPHRSLNVTAFEKRLKDGNDVTEEVEKSLDDPSSLSLSSSTSLNLKTPFIDVRTERKALQRKGSNRRKVSEEDFGAAVDKRERGNYHGMSNLAPGQVLGESTYSEGFTLGLSKLSEPDISTDIVLCNTALYAKTDAVMSNYSTLATQDKPTVMASQIQRDMLEQLNVNQESYSFPMEKNSPIENRDTCHSLLHHLDVHESPDKNVAPLQSEQEESAAHCTFDSNDLIESRKVENVEQLELEETDSQTKDGAEARTFSENKDEARSQIENEGEDDAESKKEEPVVEQQNCLEDPRSLRLEEERINSQTNDDEKEGEVEAEDDEEEEEGKEEVDEDNEEILRGEDDAEEEEEGDEEEQVETDMGATEDGVEGRQEEDDNKAEDVERDSQEDENEENIDNSEHITQRAQCPEGELIMPIQSTEVTLPENTEPGYSNHMHDSPIHKDDAEVEVNDNSNKKNTLEDLDPPDDVEEMEESEEEEEEDEGLPLETPAFVKEKRIFFNLGPQASPFAPKNSLHSDAEPSAPGAKPKQKAQRKPRSQRSDPGLPKSYLMNVFKHFAKTKVSADVYPVLKDVMDRFFDRLAKDLEAYALHARRSTIEVADCELLLRRQGIVNDKVPVEVLIEKYLRMDQRRLLIPIATSGNVVFPKRK